MPCHPPGHEGGRLRNLPSPHPRFGRRTCRSLRCVAASSAQSLFLRLLLPARPPARSRVVLARAGGLVLAV